MHQQPSTRVHNGKRAAEQCNRDGQGRRYAIGESHMPMYLLLLNHMAGYIPIPVYPRLSPPPPHPNQTRLISPRRRIRHHRIIDRWLPWWVLPYLCTAAPSARVRVGCQSTNKGTRLHWAGDSDSASCHGQVGDSCRRA